MTNNKKLEEWAREASRVIESAITRDMVSRCYAQSCAAIGYKTGYLAAKKEAEGLINALKFYASKDNQIEISTLKPDPELGYFVYNDFDTSVGPKYYGSFSGKLAREALKKYESGE